MADKTPEDIGTVKLSLLHQRVEFTDHDGNRLLGGIDGALEVRNGNDETLCVLTSNTTVGISEAFLASMNTLKDQLAQRAEATEKRGYPSLSDLGVMAELVTVGVPIEVHPGDIPNMCKGSKRER